MLSIEEKNQPIKKNCASFQGGAVCGNVALGNRKHSPAIPFALA